MRMLPRPTDLPPPVSPQRAYERVLVQIWQAELGFGPIGIDDDFFKIDGDSVSALNILLAFEKATEIELIPSILVENPTIRALAAIARAGAAIDDGDIVTFCDSGSTAPVYFIPGLGGEALNARPLAEALGDDIPFYGILNMDVATTAATDPTVEGIAANLISIIRKANPDGPYIVAGYCVGAIFAYEVARRLRAAGAEVPLLIMVDAVNKSDFGFVARWATRWHDFRRLRAIGRLGQTVRNKALYFVFMTPVLGAMLREPFNKKVYIRRFHDPSARLVNQAYRGYRPAPYDGRIVLYTSADNRSRLSTNELGWAGVAGAGLEIVDLPGDHLDLLKADYIPHFCDDLRERILATRRA